MPGRGGVRELWVEQNIASIESLMADIAAAIRKVNPEIAAGLMSAGPAWTTYSGQALDRWFTALGAGALWWLPRHFESTQPAAADVRVYRGKRLAREVRFPIRAGEAVPGALLLSSGTYRIRLVATDGVGRVRTLTWYALLQ